MGIAKCPEIVFEWQGRYRRSTKVSLRWFEGVVGRRKFPGDDLKVSSADGSFPAMIWRCRWLTEVSRQRFEGVVGRRRFPGDDLETSSDDGHFKFLLPTNRQWFRCRNLLPGGGYRGLHDVVCSVQFVLEIRMSKNNACYLLCFKQKRSLSVFFRIKKSWIPKKLNNI